MIHDAGIQPQSTTPTNEPELDTKILNPGSNVMQRHWSLIAAAVFLIAPGIGYSRDNQAPYAEAQPRNPQAVGKGRRRF